jgi:Zn-dependent peptidase ImmA (M78 family)
VAIFFFPSPPEEADLKAEFRTLPDRELESFQPETRLAVREARGFVDSLYELTNGINPSERNVVRAIQPALNESPVTLAGRVREFLGVRIEEQLSWRAPDLAMKEWRGRVEAVGVFVFKRAIAQKAISGFCLQDVAFPIIVVNNSTPHTRQQFTLFHELGHLLFATSGITKLGESHLSGLSPADRQVEIACNSFAAEVLLPAAVFPWDEFPGADLEQAIATVAQRFHVSREVVLRRLRDGGKVDQATYAELTNKWYATDDGGRQPGAGGGNYYANQATYLGDAFLRLALGRFRDRRIGVEELAGHLRMKASKIRHLEEFFEAHR